VLRLSRPEREAFRVGAAGGGGVAAAMEFYKLTLQSNQVEQQSMEFCRLTQQNFLLNMMLFYVVLCSEKEGHFVAKWKGI
jgi:hypothetical protein